MNRYMIMATLVALPLLGTYGQYSGPYQPKLDSDTAAVDAFGRIRVSEPKLVFQSKMLFDKSPLIWSEWTNSTGSVVYSNENSALYMNVATGGVAIVQTKRKFVYQPGKSQQILLTGVLGNETGTIKRIGYFSTSTNAPFETKLDGLYFEMSNGVASVNIAKYIGGDASSIRSISQTNWNIDRMDGLGRSKFVLDLTKAQIFLIDFEWLGVGSVRFGFVIDGNIYYVHRFNNANTFTSVYMKSSNQPLRYEIRSLGGTGTLQKICSTINSEGGEKASDMLKTVTGPSSAQTLNDGLVRGLIGIRLNPERSGSEVDVTDARLFNPSGNNAGFEWMLCLNPTYTNGAGAITWTNVADASVQKSTNFTYITGYGTILYSGYGSSSSQTIDVGIDNVLRIGESIAGALDEIWLVVRKIGTGGNDPTIIGALGIKEEQ